MIDSSLETAVSELLSGEAGVIDSYDKDFFSILVSYSFIKNNLDIKEHFFPSLHISDVLDNFARNNYVFDLNLSSRINLGLADYSELSGFCDSILFFSGFLPEFFNNRINSRDYYLSLAKKGFYDLHLSNLNNSYFFPLSENIEKYSSALFFMRNNFFADSFEKDYVFDFKH